MFCQIAVSLQKMSKWLQETMRDACKNCASYNCLIPLFNCDKSQLFHLISQSCYQFFPEHVKKRHNRILWTVYSWNDKGLKWAGWQYDNSDLDHINAMLNVDIFIAIKQGIFVGPFFVIWLCWNTYFGFDQEKCFAEKLAKIF